MTSPIPTAITSDGNLKLFYTPTVANPLAPTAAECTAITGFDLSCYLAADGWNPSTDSQVVTDARLCSRQVFEDIGQFTDKLDIKYVYQPQDPSAPDNKAFFTFRRGVTGFILARWGTAFEPDLAAADYVDVMPITCDVQQKQPAAANEKLKIAQTMRITGPQQRDVQVVA
jgi:hypothetical protein